MTRAALYARYSSDNQRDASIEDQLRICREQAQREGWKIVAAYKDAAISGASMILRPGIQMLLEDARRGQFDVVLAEALDRISRDQADVATLFKHLRFAGVPIVTLAEGEISELHAGLKGTMNALFLKDLAAKTHRGQRGRVEQGKSGGGLCYGYRVVKTLDERGEAVRGDREIDQAQAQIVRRICRDFASGKGPRAIAKELNDEGIAGPDGKLWIDTTIRGHVKRGTGIINNELYVGRLVWNRQPGVGVDPRRRARTAHHRRCAVAGRQDAPGHDRRSSMPISSPGCGRPTPTTCVPCTGRKRCYPVSSSAGFAVALTLCGAKAVMPAPRM